MTILWLDDSDYQTVRRSWLTRKDRTKLLWWTAAGLLSLAAWTGLWLLACRLMGW